MKRILTGPRFVLEALRGRSVTSLRAIHIQRGKTRDFAELVAEAERREVKVVEVDRRRLDQLADGVRHQGVVATAGDYPYAHLDEILEVAETPLLVALDEITDPHNFGAIVRSAVAMGADALIVPKRRSAPITAVVARASAGATEHAHIVEVTNLQRTLLELGELGLSIVGLAGEGDTSLSALPDAPLGRVLVVGSEGKGLRRMVRERCHCLASIALPGPVESLNASVATGIALYEASRQRGALEGSEEDER